MIPTSREICPICERANGRGILSFNDQEFWYRIRECAVCGFLYSDPAPTSDDIAQLEDSHVGEEFEKRFIGSVTDEIAKQAFIVDLVSTWIEPPANIVEIGPGYGFALAALRSAGFEAVGVELSEQRRAIAKDYVGVPVYAALEELDKSVDAQAALMWHVLEHIPDPLPFLNDLRARLAPAAFVMLQVPSFEHLSAFRASGREEELLCSVHVSHFTRSSLIRLLWRAEFEIRDLVIDEKNYFITAIAQLNHDQAGQRT